MLKEFKEFALKGNILDLAVGIIIGGAFQKIVTSLVEDIIMPSVSLITGTVDYSNLAIQIGDISIKYGAFLTAIIDNYYLIWYNKVRKGYIDKRYSFISFLQL